MEEQNNTFEEQNNKLMQLSDMNSDKSIIKKLRFGLIPLIGRVLKHPTDDGISLCMEYMQTHKKIVEYLQNNPLPAEEPET